MKRKYTSLLAVTAALTSLFLCAGEQAEFTINGMKPQAGFQADGKTWSYVCDANLTKEVPTEFLLGKKAIKQHKKYAHIKGCNSNITLTVKAPGPVKTLDASTVISNYSDSVKRNFSITCSVDGINYQTVAEKEATGANIKLSGKVELPANKGILYIKIGRAHV